ncbi:MAG: acetate--CoA ligase family protein [Acidobacteria bacterium]|jgi:acetyltransferase|nr:acetate--CoA ligase family protein [Acidobacteriota bacterium]
MRQFLAPGSIALVGVSSRPATLSAVLLDNLKQGGYRGGIHLVNPKVETIGGLPCYPRVADLPEGIDLALLMVPARETEETLAQCAGRGIRRVQVIAAGFREAGQEGEERERRVAALARGRGVRLIGPNSMGLMNLDPAVKLNATFSPAAPRAGSAAFITQSGALGVAVLSIAARWRLGFSQFVSLGNETDVTAAELLEYCVAQPSTRVVMLYMESLGHGRELLAAGRRLAGEKPLVLLHSGRTPAGAVAAASHTGAMSTRPGIAEGIFQRAGFLVVHSLEQMLELGVAFSLGRVPSSSARSFALLTNAGGPGVLATDEAVSAGMRLAQLRPETTEQLQAGAPRGASVRNPVDLLPLGDDATYLSCAEKLLSDAGVEQLLVIKVSPPLGSAGPGLLDGLAALGEKHGKPVLASLLMSQRNPEWQAARDIPAFWFPEAAARAAVALTRYAELRQRMARRGGTGIPACAGGTQAGMPVPPAADDLFRLLAAYGIGSPPFARVNTPAEAAAFAEQVGFPVVLKTLDPEIVHKTEAGGVILDIGSPEALTRAFAAIPSTGRHGALVQKFVRGQHREVLAGFLRDSRLGPLLAFGLGGIAVEVLAQVAYLALPAAPDEVEELIDSVPASVLLGPCRGKPPADRARLVEALLRLGQIGLDHPQIAAIEVNPLLAAVASEETLAVDVRLVLGGDD